MSVLKGNISSVLRRADNTLLDQDLCLLDQFFALDDKKTVAQAITDYNADLSIDSYKRIQLG